MKKALNYINNHPLLPFLKYFDIPSGPLLGVCTLGMMVMGVHAYFHGKDIPEGVQTMYMFITGMYGGTKTVHKLFAKKEDKTDASTGAN